MAKFTCPFKEIDLTEYTQIVVKDTGSIQSHKFGWLKSKFQWPVNTLDRAMNIVANGFGYGWFPKHKAEEKSFADTLTPLNIINSPTRKPTFYLCYPDNVCEDPTIELLAQFLIEESEKVNSL